MDVKILSKTEDEAEVEVGGEDHTLMNLLKDFLLGLDDVEAASYDVNPEQSGSKTDPVLYVKTSGADPLDAVEEATERLEQEVREFEDEAAEALG
ncbi:MAG: RpoL/Rpb11 RNA polymerase subunit family protein [Halobacteriales archaeon]